MGYKDALIENKIKTYFIKELNHDSFEEEMKLAISELIQLPNRVDAIVFSTHYLTALGLRELKKNNIDVPGDIAIVSFDELSAFDLVEPPITSIIQPVNKIGDLAVEILLNSIENRNNETNKKRILETEIIIRKSCGSS